MASYLSSSPENSFRLWARASGPLAVFVGGCVLLGWSAHLETLQRLFMGSISMNPTVAAAFACAGFALCFSNFTFFSRNLLPLLASLILGVGLMKMGAVIHLWSRGSDDFLFASQLGQGSSGMPNRMATHTAINFILFGTALLLSKSPNRWGAIIAQINLILIALSSLVALMGYIYGADVQKDFGAYKPMTLPSATCFLLISTGALSLQPERNLLKTLLFHDTAGLSTRRLALAALLLPLILGGLTLTGEHVGWFHSILSISIFAVLTMVGFLTIILANGAVLHRLEEERARNIAQLRESQERFKLLSEASFEGIVISVGGVICDANSQYCQMLGYTQEELIGMRLVDTVTNTNRTELAQRIARREGKRYQGIAKRKDGSEFEFEVTATLLPMDGVQARVSTVRDISEQKAVERMKDEFVSIVSHELRTPLTSIHGSLGLIEGGVTGALSSQTTQLVTVARRNSDRLLALINDILDVQKIESGSMPFILAEVELVAFLRNALEANNAFADGLNVHLELSPGQVSQQCCVWADADRLMQVMANLLSNASKFSPANGVVLVTISCDEQMARVEIHDQGSGIPPEFRSQVFHKFAQADSSSTRRKGGTGLGLSICKAIIETMKGHIGFETEMGVGTIFWFELPLVKKHEDTPQNQEAPLPTPTAATNEPAIETAVALP